MKRHSVIFNELRGQKVFGESLIIDVSNHYEHQKDNDDLLTSELPDLMGSPGGGGGAEGP